MFYLKFKRFNDLLFYFAGLVFLSTMIYGPGSMGNFPKLIKLAKTISVFPKYDNQHIMIFIDNLSVFICKVIDNNPVEFFSPNNKETMSTRFFIFVKRSHSGERTYFTPSFNTFLKMFVKIFGTFRKLLGDFYYSETGDCDFLENQITNFDSSVSTI